MFLMDCLRYKKRANVFIGTLGDVAKKEMKGFHIVCQLLPVEDSTDQYVASL